jgi:RNA ligase
MNYLELFDEDLFDRMREEGYLRKQVHPTEPLMILNYTEKAQYDQVWNDVTEICRGLILNSDNGEVVARPMRKFFNYDHEDTPTLSLDDEVVIMDKLDGSLGILYRVPSGGYAIATRGSFASEQALHATEILNTKYADWLIENEAALEFVTPLFEIVYPENRIVCDYGDQDDLVLLGAENLLSKDITWDADSARYFFDWQGPVAEIFDFETFGEALMAEPRDGKEGFVAYFPKRGIRVKVKQEDYVALHRIVTGLNARSVWDVLANGKSFDEFVEKLPDEFHEWTKATCAQLKAKHEAVMTTLRDEYQDILRSESFSSRAQFAGHALKSPNKWALFLLFDNKTAKLEREVWARIKPEANWTPSGREYTEDN